MHANVIRAIKIYEIESHLYFVFANASTSPIHTSRPSMGCALSGCPNFKSKIVLKASKDVAVGSLYTLTIGWINGSEYTKSQRRTIRPKVRVEARKRNSFLPAKRPAVFQENWTISGMQITPAEKIAFVCDPTSATTDSNSKIIAYET